MWIRKDSNEFKCLNLFIGLNEIGSSEDLRLRKLCDVSDVSSLTSLSHPKHLPPSVPAVGLGSEPHHGSLWFSMRSWSWNWLRGKKKHGESDQSAFPTRKLMMNGRVCLAPPCVSAFIYFFMFLPPDSCCQGDPQLYGHQLLCSIRKTKNKSRWRQSNLILSSATVPNDRSS